MADDVQITAGAGTTIATDDASGRHVQIVKLALSADGSATPIDATADRGLEVDPRPSLVRLQVTPTISTGIYAAKDAIGGLYTFSGAARASGGAIRVEALQVVDKDQELADMELILFDRDPTSSPGTSTVTDNAAFDPVDADLSYVVGTIPVVFGHYSDFNDNAVAHVDNVGIEAVLNGTALYGVMVARDTPTYTSTSDLVVTLTIRQL